MVQCEMCGTETAAPKTAKIEGAELQVCADCVEFGTVVSTQTSSQSSTKYSTGSSSGTTSTQSSSTSTTNSNRSRHDLFDEMETLADDYPARIRDAREDRELSQEELAQELNEKASQIRKLERGDIQPTDAIQEKLERHLDISLTGGIGEDDTDWEADISPGTTTLGDVVKRKD